jgi:hypothetical protein
MSDDPLLMPLTDIRWPRGQHLYTASAEALNEALSLDAWVDLKLRAARWYLGVLTVFGADEADALDRLAGVEMALDGCLANLSGAVDAALARLIQALEELAGLQPSPAYEYGVVLARKIAGGRLVSSLDELETAVSTDRGEAIGWLVQLRRVRNRSTHQATVSRHFSRGGGGGEAAPPVTIAVPGIGSVHPVRWLEVCSAKTHTLTQGLLRDAEETGFLPPLR